MMVLLMVVIMWLYVKLRIILGICTMMNKCLEFKMLKKWCKMNMLICCFIKDMIISIDKH